VPNFLFKRAHGFTGSALFDDLDLGMEKMRALGRPFRIEPGVFGAY